MSVAKATKAKLAEKGIHRLTVRLDTEVYNKLVYWADREGVSVNEFIPIILDRYVDIENGNYQLPTLETQRLNQLVDVVTGMSKNMASLETVVINGFESLIGLTRGDSYLLEAGDEYKDDE